MRTLRLGAHRKPAGEVAVRTRRLRPDPVPEPTDEVRQAAPTSTVVEDRIGASYRTDVLRPTRWQDAN